MLANEDLLVTTDYVADEVFTLLKAKFGIQVALEAGQALWSETLSTMVYLDNKDIAEACRIFQRYTDKDWSFTDCASYTVMRRLGISVAFAFDHHLAQMRVLRP
jgi:predicted nucleic acid-binding protein